MSKLASTRTSGNNRSVIQETLAKPSVTSVVDSTIVELPQVPPKFCFAISQASTDDVTNIPDNWMTPIRKFIQFGELPDEEKEAARI